MYSTEQTQKPLHVHMYAVSICQSLCTTDLFAPDAVNVKPKYTPAWLLPELPCVHKSCQVPSCSGGGAVPCPRKPGHLQTSFSDGIPMCIFTSSWKHARPLQTSKVLIQVKGAIGGSTVPGQAKERGAVN